MQDWNGPYPLGMKWWQQYPHSEMVKALAKEHDASQTPELPTPSVSKEAGVPSHQPAISVTDCNLEDSTTSTMSSLVGKTPRSRLPQEKPQDQKFSSLTIAVMILCLSTCSTHNTLQPYVADNNWQPISTIPSLFPQHVTESHLSNLTAQLFPTPPRRPRPRTHAHTFDLPHTTTKMDWSWGWVGGVGGQGGRRTSGHSLQLTPATSHLSTYTRRTLHWSKLTPPLLRSGEVRGRLPAAPEPEDPTHTNTLSHITPALHSPTHNGTLTLTPQIHEIFFFQSTVP